MGGGRAGSGEQSVTYSALAMRPTALTFVIGSTFPQIRSRLDYRRVRSRMGT